MSAEGWRQVPIRGDATHADQSSDLVVVCVTGLTPQIVTETVFVLAQRPQGLPREIHILTTVTGKQLAINTLLGTDGQFACMCREYGWNADAVRFDVDCIHVIRDSSGQALSDIQDETDNAAAADFITAFIRSLSRDSAIRLHVSLAGGRKTMGFFTGCALTLYGRPDDQLSHVLVNPPFESQPNFFYPPRRAQLLQTRDGEHVSTAEARIRLADIPFVRLRHGLDQQLVDGDLSFSDAVARTQQLIDPPELRIDLAARQVWLQGCLLPLSETPFLWLVWLARRITDGLPPVAFDEAGARSLLDTVAWLDGSEDGRPGRNVADATVDLVRGEKAYFQRNHSRLNKALANCPGLAPAAAKRYLIQSSGARPATTYALQLTPEQIHIEGEP